MTPLLPASVPPFLDCRCELGSHGHTYMTSFEATLEDRDYEWDSEELGHTPYDCHYSILNTAHVIYPSGA